MVWMNTLKFYTKLLLLHFASKSTHLYKRIATGIVNGFWYLSSVSSQRVVRSYSFTISLPLAGKRKQQTKKPKSK